jgi:hypothetical protein
MDIESTPAVVGKGFRMKIDALAALQIATEHFLVTYFELLYFMT